MPSMQEFTILVDQNTILFVGLVIRAFLGLVMVLGLMFGFVVAMLYCSGKLLIFSYSIMLLIMSKVSQCKENEVIS